MAFKIYGRYREQDSLAYINVGSVLARCRYHNLRWDAGRVHIDGIRWEEKTWVQDEFIAFRDHVADLLSVKPSPLEKLETMIANCGVVIRNCRRLQARHDCTSDGYADFEGMIAAAREFATSSKKELEALLSSQPAEAAPNRSITPSSPRQDRRTLRHRRTRGL